jgi:hypothetical protein
MRVSMIASKDCDGALRANSNLGKCIVQRRTEHDASCTLKTAVVMPHTKTNKEYTQQPVNCTGMIARKRHI